MLRLSFGSSDGSARFDAKRTLSDIVCCLLPMLEQLGSDYGQETTSTTTSFNVNSFI